MQLSPSTTSLLPMQSPSLIRFSFACLYLQSHLPPFLCFCTLVYILQFSGLLISAMRLDQTNEMFLCRTSFCVFVQYIIFVFLFSLQMGPTMVQVAPLIEASPVTNFARAFTGDDFLFYQGFFCLSVFHTPSLLHYKRPVLSFGIYLGESHSFTHSQKKFFSLICSGSDQSSFGFTDSIATGCRGQLTVYTTVLGPDSGSFQPGSPVYVLS